MPGILPMKVIKVGSSSQARIAQACDRCRSKKIKCDGIRPCCSQCANVGFECKTSDKLSRRAFPRGYTESLEERVRSLEAEVRELKDLLDEKDEKIDMLSKMHSNRRPSHSSICLTPSTDSREDSSPPKDDVFRVHASPLLLEMENSDSWYMGASSGRAFIDVFKRKIQESGKSSSTFNAEAFLNVRRDFPAHPTNNFSRMECVPPRLFSDKCVQIFWQEWAPLFPVLNKSTFLRLYEEYVSDPEKMTDNHKLAQLHLVFGIAALSTDFPDLDHILMCETQWQTSLDAVLMENTLLTVQCAILATIYSLLKGDYKKLQQYKGISVAISHRLGLHQSQKRFSFGALTMEMRKKIFWTLYTVDCFSAATTGLPKLLKEEDIQCEYPSDIDDEYVTEKGFLPTLPGESSKVSAALALFRVSRILSKVLEKIYPAASSHDLSLQLLSSLDAELNEWSDSLPTHLKLTFVQDKPSTDITGDRSALLSLAYYYIRTLIHRPAVGSTLGSKASSSVLSLAESSKHTIQIVQLLEERSMSFSFCINKNEVLTLCGLSLLYQGLDLKQEGKLMKDGQRLVCSVVKYLDKMNAPGALDFRRLAASMMSGGGQSSIHRQSIDGKMPAPSTKKFAQSLDTPRKQPVQQFSHYSNITCSSETNIVQNQKESCRRATMPNSTYKHRNKSQSSLDSVRSESSISRREYGSSISHMPIPASVRSQNSSSTSPKSRPNLDYLSLSGSGTPVSSQPQYRVPVSASNNIPLHTPNFPTQVPARSTSSAPPNKTSSVTPAEWESLLSALDSGDSNIYDAVYGGPSIALTSTLPNPSYRMPSQSSSSTQIQSNSSDLPINEHVPLTTTISNTSSSVYGDWSPESWDMTILQLNEFDLGSGPAQSVLSFSEESLSSGDDLEGLGLSTTSRGGSGRHSFDDLYHNNVPLMNGEGYLFEGLEGGFDL